MTEPDAASGAVAVARRIGSRRRKREQRSLPAALEQPAVVEKADCPRQDEEYGDLGLQEHRDGETGRCNEPLQTVFHTELCKPVARMQNERDDSRAHAIEDAADALQVTEMHKQRTQRGDD